MQIKGTYETTVKPLANLEGVDIPEESQATLEGIDDPEGSTVNLEGLDDPNLRNYSEAPSQPRGGRHTRGVP